jgi:hypothetical protein
MGEDNTGQFFLKWPGQGREDLCQGGWESEEFPQEVVRRCQKRSQPGREGWKLFLEVRAVRESRTVQCTEMD